MIDYKKNREDVIKMLAGFDNSPTGKEKEKVLNFIKKKYKVKETENAEETLYTIQNEGINKNSSLSIQNVFNAENTLVEISENADITPVARLNASNSILDRVGGKPQENVEFSGKVEHILTEEQINELINRRAKKNSTSGEI